MGDAGNGDGLGHQQLGDVVGGGLPFHGRVGRQDHFSELARLNARNQLRDANRFRAKAIQG
ncbi:hypothetical protein D3C80_2193760 [compost metagenome]